MEGDPPMPRRSSDDDERAEYDRLRAKYEASEAADEDEDLDDEDEDDDEDDDDSIVFVSGKRADAFMEWLTGRPARKRKPRTPAAADEDDDEDLDDEAAPVDDPKPPAGHRFFRR